MEPSAGRWSEKPEKITSFKDLLAWRKAMDLVDLVYRITEKFPKSELFGLRMQMRRAVISVPSNTAEGYVRHRRAEYLRFLDIARGSLGELETQSIASQRLGFIKEPEARELFPLIDDVGRLLFRLAESVANSQA